MLLDGKPCDNKKALKYFNLSKDTLKKLGVDNYTTKKFNKLNDIFKSDNGMVIAQCLQNSAMQLNGKEVKFKNGEAYVMPLQHFTNGFKQKNPIFKPYRHSFKKYFNRYNGENLDGKRLLISRTGGLGDIIVLQSVMKAIKHKFPTCEIVFATSPGFVEIVNSFPKDLVSEVVSVPYPVDILKQTSKHLYMIHAVENCNETTNMCFFEIFQKVSGLNYDYNNYISELIPIKLLDDTAKNYILPNTVVLHMRSTTKLRQMVIPKWIKIMEYLTLKGLNIGIIDHPSESDNINKFIDSLPLKSNIQNLAKYSITLNHTVALLNNCLGGICIDSGIAHMLGALRKPTVAIGGPYKAYDNVYKGYPTIKGIDAPNGWNGCGKYPCHYNAQESSCPYVASGVAPGCIDNIELENLLKIFINILNDNQ